MAKKKKKTNYDNMTPDEFVVYFCLGGPWTRNQIIEKAYQEAKIPQGRSLRLIDLALSGNPPLLYSWVSKIGGRHRLLLDVMPKPVDADLPANPDDTPPPTPKEFRRSLKIDQAGTTGLFVPQPWQEKDFKALDQAWHELVMGTYTKGISRRAWIERPRGHSKTSDLALSCAYVIAWARTPLRGLACAADQEQAKILRDAVATLARLNPELGKRLSVQKYCITSQTGSRLDIMASDVGSSWGQLVDFIIADEVCHWKETAQELWNSLVSTAGKRKNCVLVAITNAGFMETWQWERRELYRESNWWHFSSLEVDENNPPSSWIDSEEIQQQKRDLPEFVFDRLWRNVWTSGTGDALQQKDIQACTILHGPLSGPEDGWIYYGGIDLSVSRDTSAVVVVGKKLGRVRLARIMSWKPPRGGKIDFSFLRQSILELHHVFHPHFFVDPYQAELLTEDLQSVGIVAETVTFTGKNMMEMASALVEIFSARQIELYHDPKLMNDLRRLKIESAAAGYRLNATRTASGHVDVATALALAVLGARRAGNIYIGFEFEKPQPTINDKAPTGVYVPGEFFNEADSYMRIFGNGESDDGPSVVHRDMQEESESRWAAP